MDTHNGSHFFWLLSRSAFFSSNFSPAKVFSRSNAIAIAADVTATAVTSLFLLVEPVWMEDERNESIEEVSFRSSQHQIVFPLLSSEKRVSSQRGTRARKSEGPSWAGRSSGAAAVLTR